MTFQPLWFTVQFLFLLYEKYVEKVYGFPWVHWNEEFPKLCFVVFSVHEILKGCLVRWLVKLHFYHYYWPRNERGGNHTRWLMPISLHKSFPVLFSNHQRTDQSHLQNALNRKKNHAWLKTTKVLMLEARKLKSINFLCKFQDPLQLKDFEMLLFFLCSQLEH